MSIENEVPNAAQLTVGQLLDIIEQAANDRLSEEPNDPYALALLQAVANMRNATPQSPSEAQLLAGRVNKAHAMVCKPDLESADFLAAASEMEHGWV